MKPLANLFSSRTLVFWQLLAAILFSCNVHADENLTAGMRQGEVQQVQIKGQLQRVTEDLTAIINELDRNGIAGDDIKTLTRFRNILGDITDKDMAVVISLLQEARGESTKEKSRNQATDAVVQQRTITVKLRQLLLEYKRQEEIYELSVRFSELAHRENLNLKEAKSLVRASQNKPQLDELQKSNRTLQTSEQEAIRDEAHDLLTRLGVLVKEVDTETAERLAKSLKQAEAGQLEEYLNTAADRLKGGQLFLAANAEKNARDRLYELSALVAPPEDTATKLRKASEVLDKLIDDQAAVAAMLGQLPPEARPSDETAIKERFIKVEEREADNVDVTDRLRKSLGIIAPAVSGALKQSQDQMQETRGVLNLFKRDPAFIPADLAMKQLQSARQLLDAAIHKSEKEQPKGDAIEQAKALKERIIELRKAQQQHLEKTAGLTPVNAAELSQLQAEMEQTATDLQLEAGTHSVPAAGELSAAAKDMADARKSIDQFQSANAMVSQKSAVTHLINAEKWMDAALADLEKDNLDLRDLEASRQKVVEVIKNQQHVTSETAQQGVDAKKEPAPTTLPATKPTDSPDKNQQSKQPSEGSKKPKVAEGDQNKNTSDKPPADDVPSDSPKLSEQQQQVAQKTEDAKNTLPQSGREAQQPLESARENMGDAKKSLDMQLNKSARDAQENAMDELNKAKDILDGKIAGLKQKLGREDSEQQQLDDAARAVDQAQKDLNNAKEKNDANGDKADSSENAAMKDAAKKFAKVADEINNASAAAKKGVPKAAQKSMKQARTALNDAAQKAAAGDKPGSKEKVDNAQDALAKAKAALEMAKEGMKPGEMADSKDPGQPSPQAGKSEGENPGKTQPNPNGPPKPGNPNENKPSVANGSRQGTDANAQNAGPRGNVIGSSSFMGLPPRDRQTLKQTQKEKYPEEYSPAIEQYLKNLSDSENK